MKYYFNAEELAAPGVLYTIQNQSDDLIPKYTSSPPPSPPWYLPQLQPTCICISGVLATPRAVLSPPLPRATVRGNAAHGRAGRARERVRGERGCVPGRGSCRKGRGGKSCILRGLFALFDEAREVYVSRLQEQVLSGLRHVCSRLAAQLPRLLLNDRPCFE